MKKTIKGYVMGFLSASLLVTGIGYAANTTTLYDVVANGIKIVIDGQKINPTDANGNTVEPIIHNGTTYLPVRAVANAFGKAVYWDGPNYTVYLGNMDGKLEYPSKELSEKDSIGSGWMDPYRNDYMKDNYGNLYSHSIILTNSYSNDFDVLCNYKYSKLKGTIYVVNGCTTGDAAQVVIKTDGKTVYTSPEITKKTAPINLDINVTGCNDLEISVVGDSGLEHYLGIGEIGLYQ